MTITQRTAQNLNTAKYQ